MHEGRPVLKTQVALCMSNVLNIYFARQNTTTY
nr:MAG TPA: hypothetical protein [Caudoviricetes sp.]